jgi:hypothetical protein
MLQLTHHILFKQQNYNSGTIRLNMVCMGYSHYPYFLPERGQLLLKTKLRGMRPRENYTDQATAAFRQT